MPCRELQSRDEQVISLSNQTTVQGLIITVYPKPNEARTFTNVDRKSSRRHWSECRLNCNIASPVSTGTLKRSGISIVECISSRSPPNGAHPSPTAAPLSVLHSASSVSVAWSSPSQPDGALGPGRPNCGAISKSI